MKRFILIMIAVMLIISMTAPAAFADPYRGNFIPPGQAKKIAMFNDLNNYDWARESIMFLADKGILRGVGYGIFSPQRSASEIEVLVMLIRMLGLEDEIDDHPTRYDELPEEYEGGTPASWMIPYIALAWDEGILNEDNIEDFRPNSSASREETAKLIITALEGNGDYEDVVDELGEWFDDDDEISGKYGWFVYKMKLKGFMIGYKNKFQPKKSLSRAECAVLMYRIFNNYDFDYNYGNYDYVTGELINVDFNSSGDDTDDEIEIRTDDGTPKYDIHEDVEVFDDDDELTLEELDDDYKGDTVRLKINNDDLVVKIDVIETSVEEDEETGTLEDFDYDDDVFDWVEVDSVRYSDIDEDVEIEVRNTCCEEAEDQLDELETKHLDLEVKLYLEDDVVVKIIVYYDELEGELEYDNNLDDDGTVDIIPEEESSPDEFDFDENIEIFMNGEEVSISEFEDFDMDEDVDYEVKAGLLGNNDIICMCISYDEEEANLEGTLSEFDYDDDVLVEITLEEDGDETVFYDIDEDVEILVGNNCDNDAEDEIDRLSHYKHVGLEVEITEENGDIVEILIFYEELEGELEYDANLDDDDSVDIIPKGKSSPDEFDFDKDIEIFMNGEEISITEYEDFDMDNDTEYKVEARLLANGDIISLCIFYDD
ncbi:S-layer homology domain-containing protein [Dethiosulfatibacter aminovorans DSM 17477]|uniref:S-layer homology domain-containing protein n=1 Tax=Dethiosulfatibacter aminovorans DSM 17477 TaxID=1121476 RepID=A0A1M6J7R3_9FIRM|nr:S-layer homology domain-containing protein [Dethiosulfatibacter aminovorans]SHJ42753.1 S-layer homology domain-containing protein [Dethiosulfatibacter aminovorans DSM 17477]